MQHLVLVAGASGLVGRELVRLLEAHNIAYITTYSSRPTPNGYIVDYTHQAAIDAFLDTHQPTAIVNCIVQRQTDVCEQNWEETRTVNIEIAANIAKAAKRIGAHLIHISTDYVFDGAQPPYDITAQPNPLQNYGISKRIAEDRVRTYCPDAAIVRVPVLYTDRVFNLAENAVTLIGKKVLNQIKRTQEDDYSIRRPVYIPDMCEFLLDLMYTRRGGLLHFYNPHTRTTKYKMAQAIATHLGVSAAHIQPSDASNCNVANRPYDTQLVDSSYAIDTYKFVSLEEGLRRSFASLWHPSLRTSDAAGKVFVLLDLDGTLVDTDSLHYKAYAAALAGVGVQLSRATFDAAIHEGGGALDKLCADHGPTIKEAKQAHYTAAIAAEATFMPGAEEFLRRCLEYSINIAIVTNTSAANVSALKAKLPLLAEVSQWIVREDYTAPKPSEECYRLACMRFHKGEPYIVGVENTIAGYKALRATTSRIYYMTTPSSPSYATMEKEDVYLISSFDSVA